MIMIQGMDMPKQGHCKIVIIHNDGDVEDFYSRDKVGRAMQVPPHGGLIDADALVKETVVKFYTTNYFSHICNMIDTAPTIIPADTGSEAET